MIRNVIIILGICLSIGIVSFLLIWNKPHRDISDETAIEISAQDLSRSYEMDEAGSNKQFLNKALQVSGTVKEITNNQDNETVIILDDMIYGVQCTMKDKDTDLIQGKHVVLKGICNGYTIGVSLSDCILIH